MRSYKGWTHLILKPLRRYGRKISRSCSIRNNSNQTLRASNMNIYLWLKTRFLECMNLLSSRTCFPTIPMLPTNMQFNSLKYLWTVLEVVSLERIDINQVREFDYQDNSEITTRSSYRSLRVTASHLASPWNMQYHQFEPINWSTASPIIRLIRALPKTGSLVPAETEYHCQECDGGV